MLKRLIAISTITVILSTTVAFDVPSTSDSQTPNTPTIHYNLKAKKKYVYVAPYSGTKYHCTQSCRGLSRANSVVKITKKSAKEQGYTKCKICY